MTIISTPDNESESQNVQSFTLLRSWFEICAVFSDIEAERMNFFTNVDGRLEIPKLLERSKAYKEYLLSIKDRLPVSAFEFATANWHYDYGDHRCPHDSWVESLTINEPASRERLQHRSVAITVRLLGAFHDGHILIDYADVQTYSLVRPKSLPGHGDWLVDEIRSSENGLVLHEVLFSSDSRWLIEARDVSCEWRPSA
jgi:WD40 repeat protein